MYQGLHKAQRETVSAFFMFNNYNIMKETILTVTSEKLKTVFFRGAITCAYLLEHKNSLNGGGNYRLYLYAGNIRVFEQRFAFNPSHITAQLRAQDVPIFETFQQDLTMQQAQDLFDLSK